MPLARLELRNEYGLGDSELYRKAASGKEGAEAILQGVSVSGLVGILRLLGDVAEFGAEIFHDLHEQVMITAARGQKMLSRIKKIEEALPSIEDAIHRKASYIDLVYEIGSSWHADLRIMDGHLSYDDLPQFIMESYEECRDPPRLYLLDKYDRAGTGACLKRYSDPSYFKRAWATSEPEKTQQIQKEKKLKKFKRKLSRFTEGDVQDPLSSSQCNSLASSERFAPLSNDDQSLSAESSLVSEMRLKSEVISAPQLLNTMNKLNFTGHVSETNHSILPNDLDCDRLSVSNIQNNHEHPGASQLHNDELVFDADDDSQYDFPHWKATSRSPSVIWDEKSELVKAAGVNSDDTLQDSNSLVVNSESSKVEEPTRTRSFNQVKPVPIIADLSRSSCDQNQFEEINETDNYVDALNTLESDAETDSECQKKCMQTLSNMEHQKNESGVSGTAQYGGYANIEAPMSLHESSNEYRLPNDTYLDVSRMPELMQSSQEAGLSPGSLYDESQLLKNSVHTMLRRNAFQGTDDDQPPCSIEAKSGTMLNIKTAAATSQIQSSPPISISSIPSTKLWTNGTLLGLEPSKPVDVSLPNGTGERTRSDSLNNGVKSDKQDMVNGKISKQLNSIGEVRGLPESLSLADQRILNSNPFLSRKYLFEENGSVKHSSAYIAHNDDGLGVQLQQNSQEQSEALSLIDESEGGHVASPIVLTTSICQVHQTTKSASSKESEPCSAFNVASPSMDSVQNSNFLSPSFSGLPQRNLVQCIKIKPSVSHAKSSTRYELGIVDNGQLGDKPLADNQSKRLNGVASQTFYEQNLASQTFHEMSLINKSDYGALEKSNSSGSLYSRNSSPPLEHMKISFHPLNSLEASNLKLEQPDGCINKRIDGSAFSSFRLFPGCTLPAQDGRSESDDDTFCKSHTYSTEDLLSARSDSNSEIWDEDDFSGSKTNELSDDLRRISSSTASISSGSGFEHMNHVDQEIGLKDLCTGNDTDSFQPSYTTNIPTFESLLNKDVKYDSFSISPNNTTTITPTELPPPPPLPPIQWRLVRSSYEVPEDNYSNIGQMVHHFEDAQNQSPPAPAEIEGIIRWPLPLAKDCLLAKDGQYKKMQDNQVDSRLLTHELDSREQVLHQIRDTEIQHKLKQPEESKSQIASSEGVEEKEDLLHQIRTKTLNLRRTATSRSSFVAQPTANNRVAAILEKANAIRQVLHILMQLSISCTMKKYSCFLLRILFINISVVLSILI
ncbi:hypothetical protein IEQ34_021102 [Dendrobium chrysotoxum]|uniref:Protein SCAR n=1 Tax=Dendrobium chrysotoxum TaxID=161865 RepID=A0AAV7G3R8_DENCH|nr:hypothetical protein IEQ34_021102 [Dendrobium chrysotoxum]